MGTADPAAHRLTALDWLRGLVMALMAVDHCDAAFNAGHLARDSVWMGPPRELPAGDFLTRWCTHLCAPTFVFLAGASMALSVGRALARGRPAAAIDRHWLLRGAVLVALEVTVVSFMFRQAEPWIRYMLQVLFAIGAGLMVMVLVRRLPSMALVALAFAAVVVTEWWFVPTTWTAEGAPASAPLVDAVLISGGMYPVGDSLDEGVFAVMYPLVPWLTPMLLGHVFGRVLLRDGLAAARKPLWIGGAVALLAFALLRWSNGFGNLQLQRFSDAPLQWLRCSKYPPSATFLGLELGIMALLLLALIAWSRRGGGGAGVWRDNPILVLGQVPLFFYVLHLPVIGLWDALGLFSRPSPWPVSWLAAFVTVLVLWPVCWWYRRYKQTRGHGWTRFL